MSGPPEETRRGLILQKQREREAAEHERQKEALLRDHTVDRFVGITENIDERLIKTTIGLVTLSDFKKTKDDLEEQQRRLAAQIAADKQRQRRRKSPNYPSRMKRRKNRLLPTSVHVLRRVCPDSQSSVLTAQDLGKPKKFTKNPGVDTSFLPDREREERERTEREQLRKEWLAQQERMKTEPIEVTYSFWDGSGHRKSVEKGDDIATFLSKCRQQFPELRGTSVENLMYIKHYTFYDFIINKARGKSGPLFNFDVHDDVRLMADATVEKDESHAGKVVERSWYNRYKHFRPIIMPVATRSASPEARDSKRAKTDHPGYEVKPGEEIKEGSEAELVERQMSLPVEYSKTYEKELEYKEKLVLAPMVRTGSSETGVITYHKGQGPIFSTHPVEKPYRSSNPELAVKAAQTVQQDVSGITHSGMGAALLSTPDILLNILRALLETIPLPISCKIRLLPTQPSTLHLVSRILRTGIRNLTVHCRTRDMRPGERALWERLGDIVELGKRRGIPVTCNGDGDGWSNWEQIRSQTGADSVMIARAAERNPSVFQPTGPNCNLTEVVPRLLAVADYTKNPWGNTKFLLNQFKPSPPPISNMSKVERRQASEAVAKSKSVEQAADGLNITLGDNRVVFEQIASKIKGRNQDINIFEERHQAEIDGTVQDEPGRLEEDARVDGFEVGVGQARQEL
ncbi:hypothetical protein IAU60_005054 [Kwoniella sp. DSM 27419]